jgi:hypothetical protein
MFVEVFKGAAHRNTTINNQNLKSGVATLKTRDNLLNGLIVADIILKG